MQFLMLFAPAQSSGHCPDNMHEMQTMIEESKRSGELIFTGGLVSSRESARLASSGGKITVTDGPFIEATEVIGGFALQELPSMEAAIEATKKFLKLAGDGVVEVRPLMQQPPA